MLRNLGLVDVLGNPASVAGPDNELCGLDLFTAIRTVVWNLPRGGLTISDSERARDVLLGLKTAESMEGVAEWTPDTELLRWLEKKVRAHAPSIFGINAIILVEALAHGDADSR
tara:strand:+ start:4096 stop:4437 length:342 start_codon:yes stop_codon:yes gene_type:complete